jgi:hypothetical protein
MIVSASRRTDMPAYYSEWFFDRLKEGGVVTRNPFNQKQERYVPLNADEVEGFVFWSKNPAPMLGRLHDLSAYPFYFQYTLNAYGYEIEPAPPLDDRIETFRRLSAALGPSRVIWRYDPIFANGAYTEKWHENAFAALAGKLSGYTHKVTISFLDVYKKIAKSLAKFGIEDIGEERIRRMASTLAPIARSAGLAIDACAEPADLAAYGIGRGRCVDASLLSEITKESRIGARIATPPRKDPNQRPECGCARSVDIGAYGTCKCGCIYCYARYMRK